jgi:hypothetical protein
MSTYRKQSSLRWDRATGLMARPTQSEPSPMGMLVPDSRTNCDQVAVVYDKGNPPPEITVQAISGTVTSVHANGVPVAIVARATGPGLSAEDVLLVERSL